MKITRVDLSIFLLRLFAGVVMFFAGIEKVLYTTWGGHTAGWSAGGYLRFVAGGGFLNPWFQSIAGNATVDNLVMFGEVLIGLGLLLGLLTRAASFFGIIMNGLFWASEYLAKSRTATGALEVNAGPWGVGWANGPLTLNAALIAMYIVFILVGAGLTLGLDSYVHRMEIVKKNSWLQAIFG